MPGWLKFLLNLNLLIFILFCVFFFPTTSKANWTNLNYDFSHRGSVPYTVSDPIELKWTTQNITAITSPPSVDSEGNIYLTSNQGLVALDKTGQIRWQANLGTRGTPIIDNEGSIYFTGGNCNAFIYSYDKSGHQKWAKETRTRFDLCGNSIPTQLAFSQDKSTLYVGITYPNLSIQALDLNGTLIWQTNLKGQNPSSAPSVASDGTIYIGTGGNGYLFALFPNGTIKWQRFTASGFTVTAGTPSIDSLGNIYLTTFGSNPPTFLSLSPAGNERWRFTLPTNTTFTGMQAITDSRAYLVEKTNLYALDTITGQKVWQWTAPSPITTNLSSPTIDKDNNIYLSAANKLFIIDQTGNLKNTITLSNSLNQPIIAEDNLIYVHQNISSQGYLHALGKKAPTKTPVIFIPGIGGSELKVTEDTHWSKDNAHGGTYTHNYLAEEKVWMNELEALYPGNDDYFDILRMNSNGINSTANIISTGTIYSRFYQSTIDKLKESYILNENFFIYPYDWRRSIKQTVNQNNENFEQFINFIKQTTGSQKVDLIAHSMGGLIARNYIQNPHNALNIRKLITLGSPNLGSVKFLKALNYGDCLFLNIGQNCLALAPSEVKDLLQNMISGFELSPSQKYYLFYSGNDQQHPIPFVDEIDLDNNKVTGPLNYEQTKILLTNLGHNTSLYSYAEDFHQIDDQLNHTNGVETIIIAGSGFNTLGQIIEGYKTNFFGKKISKHDEKMINGDGTVPLFSASLDDPQQNISLKGGAKVFYSKQQHSDLSNNGPAMNLVKNILNNDNSIPFGVSTQPFPLKGKLLGVFSPINIHAYDQFNNHTGPLPNGDFEVQIPGSSYDTLGDSKFIFLPEEGQYEIKFEATDQGSFDFKIKNYENDINTQTILYKDIPLTENTTAQTILDTTSIDPPTLNVDVDGNGNTDLSLIADSVITGNQLLDNNPPQTNITLDGTKGENGWYKSLVKVSLDAIDSDSGILKTEYSLDEGIVKTYFQPFEVSDGKHTLKVKSTDNAGNEEEIKIMEINVDKIPPIINLTTTPNILWPPNHKLVNIEINGSSTDNNLLSTSFYIEDEYNLIEPIINNFGQIIQLQASRKGNDMDGRNYLINVLAKDSAGNETSAKSLIKVPHN